MYPDSYKQHWATSSLPLPPDLRDQAEAKYPHLKPIAQLETLYTDAQFLDDLEDNVHWKEPYSLGLSLRKYLPKTSDTNGIAGEVENNTSD